MIEIIREEECGNTTERHSLPKDIRQMGRPDIGDRIYVENEVYQFLHPYSSVEEKTVYVLLGYFEHFAGKDCVFVEAAIRLEEIVFDGELPLWNDQTWAYIYRQLRREYDNMVLVGWAMDIKGQLPNMSMRVEQLHQRNFGGTHQVLFLMDSLEREEAFYDSRNGHLHRREGFYVYYDKAASYVKGGETDTEIVQEEAFVCAEEMPEKAENPWDWQTVRQGDAQPDAGEKQIREAEAREDWQQQGEQPRGIYRQQAKMQEARRLLPSYASTFLLAAVVCVLGAAAYLNNEKMRAMEATLVQMNQVKEAETEEVPLSVEQVEGNIKKQETHAGETAAGESGTENRPLDGAAQETGKGALGEMQTAGGMLEGEGVSAGGESAVVEPSQTGAGEMGGAAAEGETIQDGAAQSVTQAGETQENKGVPEGQADDKAAAPTGAAAMTEAQMYLKQGYYVVQKGDSLVGICRRIYQTSAMMDKLCEVNEIENADAIYAGQKLILPN